MRLICIVSFFILFIASCDKNKEFVQYTEYFHSDADSTYSFIAVPNSFTPGNDGYNDYFHIACNTIKNQNFSLKIFTRNGELVYYSSYYDNYWDGTKLGDRLPADIYFYKIEATDFTGYVYDINGQVNILR